MSQLIQNLSNILPQPVTIVIVAFFLAFLFISNLISFWRGLNDRKEKIDKILSNTEGIKNDIKSNFDDITDMLDKLGNILNRVDNFVSKVEDREVGIEDLDEKIVEIKRIDEVIKNKIQDLYDWHDKEDARGRKVWYFQFHMKDMVDEILRNIRNLLPLIESIMEDIEEIQDEVDK